MSKQPSELTAQADVDEAQELGARARILAEGLTKRLGKQVVVENRPGAGTIIGNDAVAKSKPDGYTLLMNGAAFTIAPAFYKKLPYDALRDYLKRQKLPEFVLSFDEIESITGTSLPRAAQRASWWETLRSPQEKMPQREACLAGGYIATRLADGKSVRFKRMK